MKDFGYSPRIVPISTWRWWHVLLIVFVFLATFTSCYSSSRPTRPSPPRRVVVEHRVVHRVHDPCAVPYSLECYLARARDLMREDEFFRARSLLEEADRRYPNNTEVLALLGHVYVVLRDQPRRTPAQDRQTPSADQHIGSAPSSVVLWVQIYNHRIFRHSQLTNVRGGLEVDSIDRRDGRVYVTLRGKVQRSLRYLLVLPNLPDGVHYLTARRQ